MSIFETALWIVVLSILGTINFIIVVDELVTSKKNETPVHPGPTLINVIGFACTLTAIVVGLGRINREEMALKEPVTIEAPTDSLYQELPPETYEITRQ